MLKLDFQQSLNYQFVQSCERLSAAGAGSKWELSTWCWLDTCGKAV